MRRWGKQCLSSALCAAVLMVAADAARNEPRIVTSTDGTLHARIAPIGNPGFETGESRIEIRSARGSWLGLWNTVKLKMLHRNLVAAGLLTP